MKKYSLIGMHPDVPVQSLLLPFYVTSTRVFYDTHKIKLSKYEYSQSVL
ncbi:MAG: hypothetical protein ABI325_12430 [Ginsengibacter sp.]